MSPCDLRVISVCSRMTSPHISQVLDVSFSPLGESLALTAQNSTVTFIDLASVRPRLPSHRLPSQPAAANASLSAWPRKTPARHERRRHSPLTWRRPSACARLGGAAALSALHCRQAARPNRV